MSTNKTTIEISATNKTDQAFRQVKGRFAEMDNAAKGLSSRLTTLSGLAGSLGVAFSAGAFTTWIKGSIDAADAIEEMAEKTGASIRGLSELKYAGQITGVSMESLGIGLKQLAKNLYAATEGSNEQAKAFRLLLGEQWQVITANKNTDEVLKLLAGGFSKVDDETTKVALAMKIFGKSGTDLLPILNQGTQGLADMSKEAHTLGVVFSDDAAKAAAQFNDNLQMLKASFAGIGVGIVNHVMMPLLDFTKSTMQAQVTWMAFMDKLQQVDKFKWSGLIGSNRDELKRQFAIIDEAAFGQINEIEARFSARPKPTISPGSTGGGSGAPVSVLRSKPSAAAYDLNAAKREGGLYDWRDILEATEALGNFTAKLQAPEMKKPIFDLGFSSVEFESLEEQQEKAAEALRIQQEELALTADALGELARRYDETFGIRIPSALEGTQLALADYGRMAADSTTQAFLIANDALGGLEDALTDFVTTGKADFKSLVDSILADVARMTIQKSITGPLSELLSNGLSSLFGGGSLSSRAAKIDIGWLGEYATGTDYVPRTGPYLLHQGEAVITAADNAINRSSAATAGQSLAISVPVTVNGNNWDSRGLRDEIETVVHKWVGRHS